MDLREEVCKSILDSLEEDGVSRVILAGEAGLGKTWIARQIYEHATERGSFFISLWLSLNKELDELSLYESIASQLSIFPEKEGSEEDDSDDDDEEEHITQDLMRLKDQIHKKIRRKKLKGKGKKYPLLVLDDEGSVTNEEKVMKDLYLGEFFAPYGPLKILLTRRTGVKDSIESVNGIKPRAAYEPAGETTSIATDGSYDAIVISRTEMIVPPEVEPHASMDASQAVHTIDKSKTLRDILTASYLSDLLESQSTKELLESLEKAWGIDHELLKRRISVMSMPLTAAVVVLAKSLNCICQYDSRSRLLVLPPKQDEVFKVAALSLPRATTGIHWPNHILRLVYELLETGEITYYHNVVDCFWHSLSLFEHCGCIYYQELIAHWILEGYFDPVRSVAKAYKDGHATLMELMNRGFLKIQEDNMVMPEVAMKNVTDRRRRGLSGTSRIGLAKVCGSDMKRGLGKIKYVDDFIKGVRATRKGEKITTILVSGNRLRREIPEKFFETLEDLEILGLLEASSVPSLSKLTKLRVLVIRNCDLLTDIEDLKNLRELHALEVSGASSLKKISDGFFKALSKLQSLHLSGLQITTSPSSISELKELHCLIIKDCPSLEDLPDIHELVKLEVVDVSGACGLQTCFDKAKGEKRNRNKNKNFYHLTKLQLIDFSETQIERLPMFQDADVVAKFSSLTRLLLHNCRKLIKLPNLKPLSGLQILDLSGTSSLLKLLGVCFEDKKALRILNMSGSNIRHLPSTIEELSNLNELLMKDCTNIEVIPNIQKLTNLEVIDVSGCENLHKIEGSFEDMSYLCEVNLSGTNVTITPELPKKTEIHCLKRITLSDGRSFEGEEWSEIKDKIESNRSNEASSSEIGEETQPNEAPASDSTDMGDVIKERLCHVPIGRDIYKNILSRFDSPSQQEVMKIHGEASANAEFVSFVDVDATRLKSFFSENKSVKYCSLRMCMDIEKLFFEVDGESLGSLETLSISNFPLLETICWGDSIKSLKKLNIDCCPKIKTLFPVMPSSLEEVNIKYCEKLETVVEGVDLSSLTNSKLQVKIWPKLEETSDDSDYVMVGRDPKVSQK